MKTKYYLVDGMDDERLQFTEPCVAIYDYLGDLLDRDGNLDSISGHIILNEYEPMSVDSVELGMLDHAIEVLDEEFGDPGSHKPTKPTALMLAAENALKEAIVRDYEPWACELVNSTSVDISEYIAEIAEIEAEEEA